jgi:hypothetical protein
MRRAAAAAAALIVAASSAPAQAGIYADDLAKCLVRSTSASDQQALVFWIYSAMSSHPQVRPFSKLTEADQLKTSKSAAELMQRLITADCRRETVEAFRYEGTGTMEAAFGVLGQVAVRNLMNEPAVGETLEGMAAYLDKDALQALGQEGGIRSSSKK